MKREALLRHLRREGGCFGKVVAIPGGIIPYATSGRRSPGHKEIDDDLARKICRDLGVAKVR